MGNYTTLDFSGIVKPEYRDAIDNLMTHRHNPLASHSVYDNSPKWEATGIDFMIRFADIPRASFIPFGGDERKWDKETGEWSFVTSLKNNMETYEAFFEIVPLFMESVNKCVKTPEIDSYMHEYALIDGKMVEVHRKKRPWTDYI